MKTKSENLLTTCNEACVLKYTKYALRFTKPLLRKVSQNIHFIFDMVYQLSFGVK